MDVWSVVQMIEEPRYKEILTEALLVYQNQLDLNQPNLSSLIKIKDIDTILDIIEEYTLRQNLV